MNTVISVSEMQMPYLAGIQFCISIGAQWSIRKDRARTMTNMRMRSRWQAAGFDLCPEAPNDD
jgi:hypothetical protein